MPIAEIDKSKISVNFIKDEPSKSDEFGSHQRVADAITAVLANSKDIKVIGLLGGWGSGKSTVIQLIEDGFEDQDNKLKTLFFTYDAWLHQSDNPRRSFLEELINLLLSHDKSGRTFYQKELKSLSGQVIQKTTKSTPVLTKTGKWAAFFITLIPLALAFVGFDTLKEAFGSTSPPQTDAGLARTTLLIGTVVLLLPFFFLVILWIKEKYGKKAIDKDSQSSELDSAIFSLFMNKHIELVDDETTISPEPTSIEFQRSLNKIMKSLSKSNFRLICIIDNLDRLAPNDSLQMWSTMRSIFLGPNKKNGPVIILPVDNSSIGRVFASNRDNVKTNSELSTSFSDKTFDLTFEITQPVTSDWRTYLEEKMKKVFGYEIDPNWIYWTRRFFETQAKSRERVNPREINRLVNTIGALFLQWREEKIPLEILSYYAINKPQNEQALLNFFKINRPFLDQISPDWQREFAALFYGIEIKKAAQILLKTPLQDAIWKLDQDEIATLKKIAGFNETFEDIISNPPLNEVDEDPNFNFSTNCAIILSGYEGQNEPWINLSWSRLIAAYNGIDGFNIIDDRLSDRISPFYPRLSGESKKAFVETTTNALTKRFLATNLSIESDSLSKAALELIKFAQSEKMELPTFHIGDNVPRFIALLVTFSEHQDLWGQIRVDADWTEIRAKLIEMLNDPAQSTLIPSAVRLLKSDGVERTYKPSATPDWSEIIGTANQIIRGQSGSTSSVPAAAEVIGMLLKGHDEIRPIVDALASEGHLSAQLNNFAKTDVSNLVPLISLMIMQQGNFADPAGGSWKSLASNASLVKNVNSKLSEYTDNYYMHEVWVSHHNAITMRPFCSAIIRTMISETGLGKLNVKTVLDNMHYYQKPVPWDLRKKFGSRLRSYSPFWGSIKSSSLNNNLLATVEMTISAGGDDSKKICQIIMARLEQLSQTEWASIVRGDSDSAKLTHSIVKSGHVKINKGSKPFIALKNAIEDLCSKKDKFFARRWCDFTLISTIPSQKELFASLTKSMLIHGVAVQNLDLLKVGGANLFKYGALNAEPDQTLLAIVIPLMNNSPGRTWLNKHPIQVRAWITKSNNETKKNLKAVLDKFEKGNAKARKDWAEVIRKQWRL